MKYVERYENKGLFYKKYYEEVPTILKDVKKGKTRKQINDNVFDVEDSLSDTTKLVFLLIRILKIIFDSDFDKSNISESDLEFINMIFEKYDKNDNRFDTQFSNEGYQLIDKLFNRQDKINSFINSVGKKKE